MQLTLNQLTRYLEFLDTNDDAAASAAREGVLTPSEARALMDANEANRTQYMNEAFQMAHAYAHIEKVERETAAARAARKAA